MVSILVSAKDKLQELTIPCIQSIHRTVKVPYQLVGIDDGSADPTFRYFRQNCHTALRTRGIGCGASRNLGLQYAGGDHILFLDNDILLDRPGWLHILVQECSRGLVGIIGPLLLDEPQKRMLPRSADGLIDVQDVAGACFMFPRSTFDMLGMLDPAFSRRGEDTDYCFRANLAGLRVSITPRVLLNHQGAGTYNWRKESGQLKAFRKKYRGLEHVLSIP